MNKTVQIPFIFSKYADKLIVKVAINHLINEFNQIINIKNDDICCCNNIMKLPFRHSLLNNLNKIYIPTEYLRIKCNSLYEINYEMSPCVVTKISVEELKLDVQHIIDEKSKRWYY